MDTFPSLKISTFCNMVINERTDQKFKPVQCMEYLPDGKIKFQWDNSSDNSCKAVTCMYFEYIKSLEYLSET